MVPLSLLLLLGMLSGAAGAAQDTLPAARTIVDRSIEAMGGEAALAGHRSRRAVGRISMPAQGVEGDVELLAARPDLMRLRMTIAGIGEMQSGYDGRVGWSVNPLTGPMLMEGKALEQMKAAAHFDAALHPKELFASLETIEQTTFEGRPAYRVKAVRTNGDADDEFFDVDTGLMIGAIVTRESPMGPVKATNVLLDYRDFAGVKIATRLIQRVMGTEQVISLSSVEFDDVAATAFSPPPEIRALAK